MIFQENHWENGEKKQADCTGYRICGWMKQIRIFEARQVHHHRENNAISQYHNYGCAGIPICESESGVEESGTDDHFQSPKQADNQECAPKIREIFVMFHGVIKCA